MQKTDNKALYIYCDLSQAKQPMLLKDLTRKLQCHWLRGVWHPKQVPCVENIVDLNKVELFSKKDQLPTTLSLQRRES